MKLYQKIARRYIQSGQKKLEEFKEEAKRVDSIEQVKDSARNIFGNSIGHGIEATVYEVSPEKVLKVSGSPENLRGEFIIFFDPQFQKVTPDAYDHGNKWRWITVENVKPLDKDDWSTFFNYLPELREAINDYAAKSYHQHSGLRFKLRAFLRDIGDKDSRAMEIFENLPKNEREWVEQVMKIHEKLDVSPYDIRPENMAIDNENNIVLIDIYLKM